MHNWLQRLNNLENLEPDQFRVFLLDKSEFLIPSCLTFAQFILGHKFQIPCLEVGFEPRESPFASITEICYFADHCYESNEWLYN